MAHSRRTLLKFAGVTSLIGLSNWPRSISAQAIDYPNRALHSICMFPPGTGADIFVRYYSRKLQELAGQPIVVENKVGAAGNLATEFVARSKPDGYTVFIAPASTVLAPAHFLFKQLNYDPDKDLESVTLLATLPFILFVAGDSPIKSVADLIDNLRQKGDKGSYGSSTTVGQVCSEIFKTQFGLKTIEVKYRDGLAGLNELMSHQIDFYFADPATTKAMVADGRLRPLMITSARRNAALPNIPSTTETGVSDMDMSFWWSVHVPTGTPKPIVEKLASWFNQFSASDETKAFLSTYGAEPLQGSAAAVDALMAKEREKWADYVRIAKIEPQ
jgi:tripartite-type tricarboxylate transporter receptor subunit TctC